MICHHTAAHAYLDRLAALAVDDALRLLPAGMRAHRWVLALCLEPDCDYELARFVPLVGGRPGESHGICARHTDIMRRVGAVRRVET